MKKPLQFFVLSLVILTVLIAVNRWDLPVMIWLATLFGILAFVSGMACLYIVME